MSIDYVWPAIHGDGESSYGPFPGGDPRLFRPDEDCCTDEEIARWYRACCAAKHLEDEGRAVEGEFPPGCMTLGDGSVWTGGGLGIGTWLYQHEAVEERHD